MTSTERRYDIDWLRVIAIAFLLIYHIGIGFQPWGVLIGFIQSNQSLESLWIPMSMLNVWRIPLLFFVSGMGVCFAMRSRSWKQLLIERSRRILLPFIFGLIVIVPLHLVIWQLYYKQDISYILNQGHLWFLANIFIYVILLSPLFFYLKKKKESRTGRFIASIFGGTAGLIIILLAFILEAFLLSPVSYETYSMTMHGFTLGLLAFLFGFLSVYAGLPFWTRLSRWRWILLSLAIILFIIRLSVFDLKAPNYIKSIESNLWIFALFGLAYKYLNRGSKALTYFSKAAYPVYILHMIFLYLASYFIIPVDIPAGLQFVLILLITFTGSFALYELIIRRIKLLRPLFGLK